MKLPPQPAVVSSRPAFVILLLVFLLLSSGCSSLNCTRLENTLGTTTDLIDFSYELADALLARALPPLISGHPGMPVLVTTFVDNNNLNKTNQLGRILQEHMTSRISQHGYAINEIKMTDTLMIQPGSGETILSREILHLSQQQQAQAILLGTFSRTGRQLYISARLVNPASRAIIASEDRRLCIDEQMLGALGLRKLESQDNNVSDPGQPLLNKIL